MPRLFSVTPPAPPRVTATGPRRDLALSAVTLDRFWKVMGAMPQRARRAAYLRWHEDQTMDSIAARLGIDRATVARDLRVVRALAQEQLADDRREP